MEFLEKSQRRRAGDNVSWEGLDPASKKVIVLGGGDTATDCIGTSLRLNAKSVQAFEILPQPPSERKPEVFFPYKLKFFLFFRILGLNGPLFSVWIMDMKRHKHVMEKIQELMRSVQRLIF